MASKEPRFEVYEREDGDWGIRLVASNGETIVPPEGYVGSSTKGKIACKRIQQNAARAKIVVIRRNPKRFDEGET